MTLSEALELLIPKGKVVRWFESPRDAGDLKFLLESFTGLRLEVTVLRYGLTGWSYSVNELDSTLQ